MLSYTFIQSTPYGVFQAFDDFADIVSLRFAEIFFFVFGIGGDQKDRFPKDEINVADPRTSASIGDASGKIIPVPSCFRPC